MAQFISPQVESSVRKRAGGQCEWETKGTWQYEDIKICRSNDFPRVLQTRKHEFKLLCRTHYDKVILAKQARKAKKKSKPTQEGQTGLFD